MRCSPYSRQVHSFQPSPSFHRSATRSAWFRTVSRKRVATVVPGDRRRDLHHHGLAPSRCGGTTRHAASRSAADARTRARGTAHRRRRRQEAASFPPEPVDSSGKPGANRWRTRPQGWKICGRWWKMLRIASRGGRWGTRLSRTRRVAGAPTVRDFSTPSLLGTHRVTSRRRRPRHFVRSEHFCEAAVLEGAERVVAVEPVVTWPRVRSAQSNASRRRRPAAPPACSPPRSTRYSAHAPG